MLQATQKLSRLPVPGTAPVASLVQRVASMLRETTAAARDRRAIARMSARELEDAGIAPANRPTIEIKPGLMLNLMSLR